MSNTIISPISNRRSRLAFSPKVMLKQEIELLFEAARWSPSAYNEQPWRFHFVSRERNEAYQRMLHTLAPGNREWAVDASLLIFTTAKQTLTLNGQINNYSMHDVGLATANLLAQATAMGIVTHPMGGFDRKKVADLLNLSKEYNPVAVIAVGYPGDAEKLSKASKEREKAARVRKELGEISFEID